MSVRDTPLYPVSIRTTVLQYTSSAFKLYIRQRLENISHRLFFFEPVTVDSIAHGANVFMAYALLPGFVQPLELQLQMALILFGTVMSEVRPHWRKHRPDWAICTRQMLRSLSLLGVIVWVTTDAFKIFFDQRHRIPIVDVL